MRSRSPRRPTAGHRPVCGPLSAAARLLACALAGLALAATRAPAQEHGPGLGNLTYAAEELFEPASVITSPRGHGNVAMVNGYLLVPFSSDGGGSSSDGGFELYDVSDPRAPVLMARHEDALTARLREAHGFSLATLDGRTFGAFQTVEGVQIWEFTDPLVPVLASDLDLPSVGPGDYSGAWWVFWQAPWLYVAGTGGGLSIVDARDPFAPVLAAEVPTGELTGMNPAIVYAVGNLLVLAEASGGRLLTLDVSDPVAPSLLDVHDGPEGYSHLFAAGHVFTSKSSWPHGLSLVHVGHDGHMTPAGVVTSTALGTGGYGSFQDGFFHSGFSSGYGKFDVLGGTFVGAGTSGLSAADEDFGQVLGNLVFAGNDHGSGSALLVHDTQPDGRGPDVAWVHPRDGATGVALTSRVGVSLTDSVDLRSAGPESVKLLRALDDVPVPGRVSVQMGLVNFAPEEPLEPETSYEFHVTGLRDLVGNAGGTFRSRFRTVGAPGLGAPSVSLAPSDPVEVGEPVTFTLAQLEGSAPLLASWDFGDGSPPVVGEALSSATHVYAAAGRRTVTVTVTNAKGKAVDTLTQVVHAALGASRPVSSRTLAADGERVYVANPDNATVTALAVDDGALLWETSVGREPSAVDVAPDGRVWVLCAGDAGVVVLEPVTGAVVDLTLLPRGSRPRGLVFAPDGGAAYVSFEGALEPGPSPRHTGQATTEVARGRGQVPASLGGGAGGLAAGAGVAPGGPSGPPGQDTSAPVAPSALTTPAPVSRGGVARLRPDLSVDATLPLPGPARGLPVSPDGATLWVTRFLSGELRGEVWELSATDLRWRRTLALPHDPGPDTEASGRGLPNLLAGLAVHPTGTWAVVPATKHNIRRGLSRDGKALTFESRARAMVAQLDLVEGLERTARRRDLDDRNLPHAATFSPLGVVYVVSTLGTSTLEVFDAASGERLSSMATGRGPQDLLFVGDVLFVHCALDRTVRRYDASSLLGGASNALVLLTSTTTVGSEALSPQVLTGKRLFHDARDRRMNRDGYLSCATCHPEGGADGRVWDFTQDGEGQRNTIDLRGRSGAAHGLLHWTANFDEVQDFERDIRGAFGGMGFLTDEEYAGAFAPLGPPKAGLSPELDALAAYLESLDSAPPSPFREPDGGLTPLAVVGRGVFGNNGCGECHPEPHFTDGLRHDVGTLGPASGLGHGEPLPEVGIETPPLRGLWASPPYFHDGRAATLHEVVATEGHGVGSQLTAADREALVAYLLQLE